MVSYLPDVNVLVALADSEHASYQAASAWFGGIGDSEFLLCPITESGFVRISTSPRLGRREMGSALVLLREMTRLPNYRHLQIRESWLNAVAPFLSRLQGHRQVTDAYLLGLAIRHRAVLVTLDQSIRALAGREFQNSLLTLGPRV